MESEFEDLTDCPVCFEPFRDPKKLTCDHTLCTLCVDRIKRESLIKCPKCNNLSDLQNVKTDFRLIQFLDALAKQAESLTQSQAEPEVQGDGLCEFCLKNPIGHVCLACNQSICTECKDSHRRTKATKDHKVISLFQQSDNIKTTLKDESHRLALRIGEFEDSVKAIQEATSQIKIVEADSLIASNNMRKTCMDEVNSLFDSFDARILECLEGKVKAFDIQREELEKKLPEIKTKYNEMETLINSDAGRVLSEGARSLTQVKRYLESEQVPHLELDIPTIKLLKNQTWKASEAATLELQQTQSHKKKLDVQVEDSVRSWLSSLKSFKDLDCYSMDFSPSARLIDRMRRCLKQNECPVFVRTALEENCHEGKWPVALNDSRKRDQIKANLTDYVARELPRQLGMTGQMFRYMGGNPAKFAVVMACDNQHMPDDMILDPGFILFLFSRNGHIQD